MNDNVIESIIEITRTTDSDEFSFSILATISQLLPDSFIALFHITPKVDNIDHNILTLTSEKNDSGNINYQWNLPLPEDMVPLIKENLSTTKYFKEYVCETSGNHLFVPIFVDGYIRFAIDISSRENFSDLRDALIAITQVCQNFYSILANGEKDTLTGLNNRRAYDSRLNTLLSKQGRNQRKYVKSENELRTHSKGACAWLAVLDIDHFKRVNDKFGHAYGDEVLLVLAQLMLSSFRHNDLLFRFGGEEFVVIFEPIEREQAELVLTKFIDTVREHNFPMVGQVTVSCGFAQITDEDHPKSVFDRADKALYHAKENGRDQIQNYETLVDAGILSVNIEEGEIDLF